MNKRAENIISLVLITVMVIAAFLFACNNKEPRAAVTVTTEDTTEAPTEPEKETEIKPLYGTVEYVTETPTDEWYVGMDEFKPVDCSLDEELQEFIYYLAYGYNIDFYFIMAVIEHESDFRENIISKTNDYGLMQINICNHEWMSERLGITDFLDPYQNVIAGTYKFWTLFERHGNDTSKVLMSYNMGSAGAKKLWDKGIHETSYSREIMKRIAEMKEGTNNA